MGGRGRGGGLFTQSVSVSVQAGNEAKIPWFYFCINVHWSCLCSCSILAMLFISTGGWRSYYTCAQKQPGLVCSEPPPRSPLHDKTAKSCVMGFNLAVSICKLSRGKSQLRNVETAHESQELLCDTNTPVYLCWSQLELSPVWMCTFCLNDHMHQHTAMSHLYR